MVILISVFNKGNSSNKAGVTLVEILIVSTIIAMMAAISFPVYKIIQQREKERRLKKILQSVRASICGFQGNSYAGKTRRIKRFEEGYRSFILERGIAKIEDANSGALDDPDTAISNFLSNCRTNGYFYPETISNLTSSAIPFDVKVATASPPIADPGDYVTITVDRPFHDWYPKAHWEFKYWDAGSSKYVMEISSKGAGTALNGSNTDDW
jgi:prepilin-type N-terminal cleavage/methylation domain-containing protein